MITKSIPSTTLILILSLVILILGCTSGTTSKEVIPEMSDGYGLDESFAPSVPTSKSKEINLMSTIVEPSTASISPDYNSTEIYTGSITIEVNSVEVRLNEIKDLITLKQGYIEYLNSYGTDYNQNANLTVRVPQDNFESVMSDLELLGIVLNKSIGSEDVFSSTTSSFSSSTSSTNPLKDAKGPSITWTFSPTLYSMLDLG